MTKVRRVLIDLFSTSRIPFSVSQIQQFLTKKNLNPNKTTVYREIAFLKKQGIIHEVQLGSDKKKYENSCIAHHHHLICNSCGQITDVDDTILNFKLNEIMQKTGFMIQSHAIEVAGICKPCQKNDN